MKLRNWTPFVFAYPKPYLSDDDRVTELDLERWSSDLYTWEQDGWNGYKDFASDPVETVTSRAGDCEDYALVAASWAHSRDKDVTLALCFIDGNPLPQHMIAAFDGNVYSSGTIHEDTDIREYVQSSQYDWFLPRDV